MADLFFYLSKIFWFLAAPDQLLLMLLLFGLLLWKFSLGRLMAIFSGLVLLTLSIYPLGNHLISPLEERFPKQELPEKIAGIIVLGGGERAEETVLHGMPTFGEGAERVMVMPELLQRYPDAIMIFTGGSGSAFKPDFRGGDVVQQWLEGQGLAERVLIERESRNTHENAFYSHQLIKDNREALEGEWLLVTSAFHMPRSMGIFRKQGWNVLPYPVDFRAVNGGINPVLYDNMGVFRTAVREWIGLGVYYLTDKTSELLPSPSASSLSATQVQQ